MREQTGRTGRRAAAGVAALLVLVCATACAPEPSPTPTPTGFASEEEAFAAAEQTYRDYVDAVNSVDLASPETFEPVYDTLTGDALASAKKSFTSMHGDGWTVSGASVISLVQPSVAPTSAEVIALAICVDVSAVALVDRYGVSQVGNRPDVQSLAATVVEESGDWRIATFDGRDGSPECSS